MRLVIDTNVLVSGLLSAGGPPGALLDAVRAGEVRPAVCEPILAEYRDVLRRPRLRIAPSLADELLATLDDYALHVPPAEIDPAGFPDADDAPFYAAALAAHCPLVTGNLKHFPRAGTVVVITPREAMLLLSARVKGANNAP